MAVEVIREGEYATYKIPEADLKTTFAMPDDPLVGILWVGIPEEGGKVIPHLLVTLKRPIIEATSALEATV